MTERVCVRCGRLGATQFTTVVDGDACRAERACRLRIQGHASDQMPELDDDRWFDYVREDFPMGLGTVTARETERGEPGKEYWVGLHAWNPEARVAQLVLFEVPRDDGAVDQLLDDEDTKHPFGTTIVMSQRWHGFELLPLTKADLVEAAKLEVDGLSARSSSPLPLDEDPFWTRSWNPGDSVPPPLVDVVMTMNPDSGSQRWVTKRPPAQEAFYAFWQAEWNEGRPVGVEGNTEYVERYAMEVIGLPITAARAELNKLMAFLDEERGRSWLLESLSAAAAVVDGDFAEALKIYVGCHGRMSPEILSLRLALGTPPTGSELADFAMLNLETKFRSTFADELLAMYGAAFEKAQVERGANLLQLWAQDCPTKEWPNIGYFEIDPATLPPLYLFPSHGSTHDEVLRVLRDVEAKLRSQLREA